MGCPLSMRGAISVRTCAFAAVATPAAAASSTKLRRPKSMFLTITLTAPRVCAGSTDRRSGQCLPPRRRSPFRVFAAAAPSTAVISVFAVTLNIRPAMPSSVLLNVLHVALIQRGEVGSGLALGTKQLIDLGVNRLGVSVLSAVDEKGHQPSR
jgi:hypothetical protein